MYVLVLYKLAKYENRTMKPVQITLSNGKGNEGDCCWE
jgi:hypothetical protein